MASRYTVDSFTTAIVASGGGVLDFVRSLPNNFVDIWKIEITPSVVGGTTQFYLHSNSTRLASEVIYNSGAWAGAKFYDPVEDNAGAYAERNEGFVGRYYDSTSALSLFCRIVNNDGSNKTYDITITYAVSQFATTAVGVPDGLIASAYANGLDITTCVMATKNTSSIDEAEFRAILVAPGAILPVSEDLRTAAEGGTFVHNGTTQLIITAITADEDGALYIWTSSAAGTWYFAWRLHNFAGWSNWTDGNSTPFAVTQRINTNTTYDTGPPSGWQVSIEKGALPNTYAIRATRPSVNGNNILHWSVQVKDASTGSWRELDDNAGAAATHYDGSGANHQFDPATLEFITPGNWGTAALGDLVIFDVRGNGTWALANCQWGIVKGLSGANMKVHGKWRPLTSAHKTGPVYDQVRLKIVKAPWDWTTEGFLGAQPNGGFCQPNGSGFIPETFTSDTGTQEFVSEPIPVPSSITSVEGRVWFENTYSRNDDGNNHSSGVTGGSNLLDGYTWVSFTDPRWWIPVFGGTQVTRTVTAAGKITVAAAGVTGANKHGVAGSALRGRIMATSDGIIDITATWDPVTFTDDGSHLSPTSTLGLFLWMISGEQISTLLDQGLWGLAARSIYTGGANKLRICLLNWGIGSNTGPAETNPTADIAMPAPGFDIDLRILIQESAAEKFTGWYTLQYQVNGGGYNTLVQATMYRPTHIQGIDGYKAVLVMDQVNMMAGDTSTLSQFKVTKGLIVGEGF
jgi:hypothetical protein